VLCARCGIGFDHPGDVRVQTRDGPVHLLCPDDLVPCPCGCRCFREWRELRPGPGTASRWAAREAVERFVREPLTVQAQYEERARGQLGEAPDRQVVLRVAACLWAGLPPSV